MGVNAVDQDPLCCRVFKYRCRRLQCFAHILVGDVATLTLVIVVSREESFCVQDATPHIPLILKGVTSCFCVRRPTTIQFEDEDIPKLDMTYESPEWDPSDPDWATQEASTMDSRGRVHDLDNVIAGG